jgi:hypothetical protein
MSIHYVGCDVLQVGPNLCKSTKPCNCYFDFAILELLERVSGLTCGCDKLQDQAEICVKCRAAEILGFAQRT